MIKKEFLEKIHNIDLDSLQMQKQALIDTRELENDQKYIDIYSGIIHLLDCITDYLED